jgi:hypothetical protein
MRYTSMNYITTEHADSERLDKCLVYNHTTRQWVSLSRAGHVSGMTTHIANDAANILQTEGGIECYIVSARELTSMMVRLIQENN